MNWIVYIVKCIDNTLYTGITNNLEQRLSAHNNGTGAKYTKTRAPVELMYQEPHSDRSTASKREYQIKQYSRKKKESLFLSLLITIILVTASASAEVLKLVLPQSTITEVHYQYGNQKNPFTKEDRFTTVITTQNASNWLWGSSYIFVDYVEDGYDADRRNFNDENIYVEAYAHLSLDKVFGIKPPIDALKDIRLVMGTNFSRDPHILKYTPGVRLSWNVPGFAFLNTDFLGYLDDSPGKGKNLANAPAEDDSWFVDVNYLAPFDLGNQKFMVTGHAEFIKGRDLDDPIISGTKKDWFLAQTQIRWDLGHALFSKPNKLFVGTEWQYWNNKLGSDVDEHMAQALVAIRF